MWSYEDYLALGHAATPPTYAPPPPRRSYLCLDCSVAEEGLTIDPIRCWACASENLLTGYTPRFYGPSSNNNAPF